jgi:RNA polymerase sigma-70 factor, ECF subfamily
MTTSPSSAGASTYIGSEHIPVLSPLNENLKQAVVERDLGAVAAARAGSTAAFDELQERYSARLYRTILRITKNREDAEDALQDTFLRAYLAIHRFEGRSSVYSWLTRIAMNSALMVLRRRRTRPEALRCASLEEGECHAGLEIMDPALNPEQLCDARQRSKCLLRAIRKLEPQLREPIELQLAGDYSIKEIADSLNLSAAAVKARLYRARVRLADRIADQSGIKMQMPVGPRRKAVRVLQGVL